jgi:uncharacterized protein
MRWSMFVILFFVLLLAINVYVWWRTSEMLGLRRSLKIALGVFLGSSLLALVLGRFVGRDLGSSFFDVLEIAGFCVQLGVVIAAVLAIPIELVRGLASAVRRVARKVRGPVVQKSSPPAALEGTVPLPEPAAPSAVERVLSRRGFLATGATSAAFVVGPASSLYGFALGRHDYTIEDFVAKLPGLPRALDGYTLVQLSDIHFGRYVGDRELAAAVDLVRSARPDAVVLTGDLIDHDPAYVHFIGELVRKLGPITRDGVFAIPGNHDYYTGVDEVIASIRAGGGTVLRNGAHAIGDAGGRFALVGVDDVWAPRNGYDGAPDLDAALRQAPRDVPRVLLCHNPEFFPEAAGKVDLMLSGHTHGGQVQLGLNPAELVVPYGYVAGEYKRGDSTLYVNRGFGTAGPPARVGSPPEVTRIVLASR